MSRDWIDVSRPLRPGIPVWPGDVPFELATIRRDDWSVSRLSTTCHVGTHAETGLHVEPGHPPLSAIPLHVLCGTAEVVDVPTGGESTVTLRHLPGGWRPAAPRVLLRTGTFPVGSSAIRAGFAGLGPGLVGDLAAAGVLLVGLDTPSVDPMESEDFPAHHALAHHGMVWIEGLDLTAAPAGQYEMVALPLPLRATEAAPTRVILRRLED